MTKSCLDIKAIFRNIFAILPNILPENKSKVNEYIENVWPMYMEIVACFRDTPTGDLPEEKFAEFFRRTEEKLEGNLEKMKYNIESPETVHILIDGSSLEHASTFLLSFSIALLTFC